MNKYNCNDELSYCLGMSLTIEAIKHKPECIKKVVLSNKSNKNEQLDYLIELCSNNDIDIEYDDKVIEKLSIKENCYCICFFKKFTSSLSSNKHILLYNFNDYGELGTILRSAVCFDFNDIVLINSNLDYFDPRCIRASMGSIFHTNIIKFDNLDEYKKSFPNQKLFGFVSKSSNELNDLKLDNNFSLVLSQNYYSLDSIFPNGYYIKHKNLDEISLSIRSSIILNYAYNQNLKR